MASQVVGVLESIHSVLRPVLSKIEVKSFCGVLDLRVGSLIVAVIQLILGGAVAYGDRWFLGTSGVITAIVLIIGASFDQKYLAVPWLLLVFCFKCLLIGYIIVDLINVGTDGYSIFFAHFFSFVFHLFGFSIVYSYYMTAYDLPTVNNPI